MLTDDARTFRRRLRESRQLLGLTQAQLGELCGLEPSAISHFETGFRRPSFRNLIALTDGLSITVDYLIGRSERVAAHAELARVKAQRGNDLIDWRALAAEAIGHLREQLATHWSFRYNLELRISEPVSYCGGCRACAFVKRYEAETGGSERE